MGAPDLLQAVNVIAQSLINAAQAAEPGAVPIAPAIPPINVQLPGLESVLVNLGGWGTMLYLLVNHVAGKLTRFSDGVMAKLDSLQVTVDKRCDDLAGAIKQMGQELAGMRRHMDEIDEPPRPNKKRSSEKTSGEFSPP